MARETAEERREAQIGQGNRSAPKRPRKKVQTPELSCFEELNERHAYLNFDGMPQPHKNNSLLKLYKLHRHKVCPPKFLTHFNIQYFGLENDFKNWFTMGLRRGNRVINSGLWDNVFLNREPVYRELCLEFYSTLRLTKELSKVKDIFEERVVVFMCGGVQRKASIAEFGVYVGMYTPQELSNPSWREMLKQGYHVKADLGDGESIPEYWSRISGGDAWVSGGYVSVNKVKSVRLRLLHRILVTSFIQRSSHWDKAYMLDLWLMKLFTEGSPRKFPLAPLVLLERMCNHSDSDLVLGHFVTRIYKYMGIFDSEACQTYLSHPVYHVEISRQDLIRARIIVKKEGNNPDKLMEDDGEVGTPPEDIEGDDEEMEEAQQEPQPPRRRGRGDIDLTPLTAQLQQIYEGQQSSARTFMDYQRRMDMEVSWLGSQNARIDYTMGYYQPMWQAQFEGRQYYPPENMPVYDPPPVRVPPYRQDGGSYFSTPAQMDYFSQPHALGGSPRGPVQFGRYTGGDGGTSTSMPSFFAGTGSGFADAATGSGHVGGPSGYGGSGSGQEEDRDWVTDLFAPPSFLHPDQFD